MKWKTQKRYLLSLFLMSLAMWVAISFLAFINEKKAARDEQLKTEIYKTILKLNSIDHTFGAVREAVRDYVITGREEYRNLSDLAYEQISLKLKNIDRSELPPSYTPHLLDSLSRKEIDLLKTILAHRAQVGFKSAADSFTKNRIDLRDRQFLKTTSQIKAIQGQKIFQLNQDGQKRERDELIILIAGSIISLFLLLLIFFLLHKQNLIRLRAHNVLQIRADQQSAIAELGQMALENDDILQLLQRSAEEISARLNVEFSKVLKYDPETKNLLLVAGCGWKAEDIGNVEIPAGENSQAGYTLDTLEPVIVEDLRKEIRFHDPQFLLDYNIVSGISVTIPGTNGPYGILGAHSTSGRNFTTDDIHFMQTIANIVATTVERNRTHQELIVKETAIESSNNAIALADLDGYLTYVNPSFHDMWGYSQTDQLTGMAVTEFWAEEKDAIGVIKWLRDNDSFRGELQGKRKDGSTLDLELSASMVKDRAGKIICMMASFIDITDRKKTEKALRKSEKHYKSLFENSPAPLWEEDFSLVKKYMDDLKTRGIKNLSAYFDVHPEAVKECISLIKIIDLNTAVLELHRPFTKEELRSNLHLILNQDALEAVRQELAAMEEGRTFLEAEFTVRTYRSENTPVSIRWQVVPGYEHDYGRIFISVFDLTEKKETENAAKRSATQYRELADSITDFFYAMDNDLKYTYWNTASQRILGFTSKQVIGKSIYELFPEIKGTEAEKAYREVLKTGTPQSLDYKYSINGKDHIFELSVYPSMGGTSVFAKDITERIQIQDALKESEERFRSIFEQAATGMVTGTDFGGFSQVNPAFCHMLGYTVDEMMRLSIAEITHPDDREATKLEIMEVASGRKQVIRMEKRYIRKDGCTVWGHTTAVWIFDERRRPAYFIAIIQDITEQKHFEAALEQSEERFRLLFEKAPLSYQSLDRNGFFIDVNQTWLETLGYSREEVIGHWFGDFMTPASQEAVKRKFPQFLKAGEIHNAEFEMIRKDGAPILVSFDGRIGYDREDKFKQTHCIFIDISERRRAEEALRESEQRYRNLFENSPVSLWEEDFSQLKQHLADLKNAGVNDLRTYLTEHPEEVWKCVSMVRILDINNRTVKLYGAKNKKELLGNLNRIAGENTLETHLDSILAVDNNSLYFEMEAINTDLRGKKLYVALKWSVIPGYEQTYERVLVSIQDITRLKLMQEKLLETADLLTKTFDSMSEAIMVVDFSNRTIISCNAAVKEVFGYMPEELKGKNTRVLHIDDEHYLKFEELIGSNINQPEVNHWEYKLRRKDGKIIFTEHAVSPLKTSNGQKSVLVSVVRDVTERKKNLDQLRKSQRQLRALAARLQDIREDERKTIAREIHDDLGQALTVMQIDLLWFLNHLSEDKEVILRKIKFLSKFIDITVEKVQSITRELRPSLLDNLGLEAALEWEGKEFQKRSGILCEVSLRNSKLELNTKISTNLYRIFQEALTNIIRHAQATHVEVKLKESSGEIRLSIKDNGIGIDEERINSSESLGLLGMQERANSLAGKLIIESIKNQGTTIEAVVPIKRRIENDFCVNGR